MTIEQITNKKLRSSGIIFSIFLSVVFVLIPLLHSKEVSIFPLIFIFLLLILSFYKPSKLKKPFLIWMKFGDYLGKFNTNLLLSIFFFGAITPASLIRNLIRFFFKKNITKKSYYIDKIKTSSFEEEY